MRKRAKPSSAAEAKVRRLFMDLPKHKWPMAPDPPEQIATMRNKVTAQDRVRIMEELQLTLETIGEELEVLKPFLLRRKPPVWAVVQHRVLAKISQEAQELLFAMEDAEEATQH